MKTKGYDVVIYDYPAGWVKTEITTDRKSLYELRKEACTRASICVRNLPAERTKGNHYVYYYELPKRDMRGRELGVVKVVVYMRPYEVDDAHFFRFVDEDKPDFVGAIHK